MYTDQLLSFIIDTNMYYVPSSLNFISPVFCLGFIELIFESKTNVKSEFGNSMLCKFTRGLQVCLV